MMLSDNINANPSPVPFSFINSARKPIYFHFHINPEMKMKILNHAFYHVKAHCFKSTDSAAKLAHNMSKGKLWEKDITYARKLLSVKQSSLKPNSLKSKQRKLKYDALVSNLPSNQRMGQSKKSLSHLKSNIAAVTNLKPNKQTLAVWCFENSVKGLWNKSW